MALDGSSLESLAGVDVSGTVTPSSVAIRALPAGPYVFLRSQGPDTRCAMSLQLLDAVNGSHVAAVDAAVLWAEVGFRSCVLRSAYLGPPSPPVALRAAVQGGRVQLAWDDLTAATDFEIEAGSGPDLSNLRVIRSGGPTFVELPDVPPGTYHLRVYGLNHQGRSGPSTEFVLTVP